MKICRSPGAAFKFKETGHISITVPTIFIGLNLFKNCCLDLFCEVVDDPRQSLCYQLGVPAELLHIYVRPVRHKYEFADS